MTTAVHSLTFYTLVEVARKTGLNYETVRRHVNSGSLVAHKHGSIWLVSEDALTAWLRSRQVNG